MKHLALLQKQVTSLAQKADPDRGSSFDKEKKLNSLHETLILRGMDTFHMDSTNSCNSPLLMKHANELLRELSNENRQPVITKEWQT